ncbi:MAG: DUF126 domain-containing protein [Holophagales bacterium]|nr:DUF126 domain-containing protein [Holophagales bacterium]MXX61312.1 DUF126 domain-containing protein [Holophagales bacterium]MYC09985.1 DUF126 domain-containing protein [Holophagales bacterium]MYD24148.1 DUF126 domain-containing protein [Holophagales bacterium]MYI34694.1 DUF126 domain-containing protein [Holophagales bacterium]
MRSLGPRRTSVARPGVVAVSAVELKAQALVAGAAVGKVLRLEEPLSFWGGVDPVSGTIIDRRHPRCGESVAGRVLVMPYGRGSSSSSSVLLEGVRLGTAPAAVVLRELDGILALGAAVARELYEQSPPVLLLAPADWEVLPEGAEAAVEVSGRLRIAG